MTSRPSYSRLALALSGASLGLLLVLAQDTSSHAADPATSASPQSPGAFPARRLLRLPADALDVIAWPVKRSLIWAERVNLPERVRDVLYFNEERTAGWYPNFSFGGELEQAGGVRVFHDSLLGDGEELVISTLISSFDVREQRVDVRYFDPRIGKQRTSLLVTLFYAEDDDEDLFVAMPVGARPVIGASTRPEDATTYELDTVRTAVAGAFELAADMSLGLRSELAYGKVEPGKGSAPPIPAEVDGFGDATVLLGGGPFFRWDTRDVGHRPTSGAFVMLGGSYWASVQGSATSGQDYAFGRYRADLRYHRPIFSHNRSILLRAYLEHVVPASGDTAPFWLLPKLDEDHGLRGFERNRFRDRGALLLNAEYRYPVWDTWDAYVFLDEGQVFDEYGAMRADRFEWSSGGGILLSTRESFLLRIQVATSDEDTLFKIGLDQSF